LFVRNITIGQIFIFAGHFCIMTEQQQNEKLNYTVHGPLARQEERFHTHAIGQLLFAEKQLIHIEYADRKILLPTQFCSWIPAFKPHRIWSASPDAYVRVIYFHSQFCKNEIFSRESVFPLSSVLKEMIRYTAKWDGISENNIYKNTFLTAIRQMLPGEMTFHFKLEIPISQHPRLGLIIDHINNHLHEDIRIEHLKIQFGLSGRTLHRLFTKELGQSFYIYRMFLRIAKAIEYLSEGSRSVKEVAYDVGYNSIPSFNKMFKIVTGENPQQFKSRLKGLIKT
jgi:AraC-like DNA-binding protein